MLESFPALTQAVVTLSWQKVGAGSLSLFQVCRAPSLPQSRLREILAVSSIPTP